MTESARFSPTLHDLLGSVRDFLSELAPRLERGPAYEAQVARYLLDMALRELEDGAALDAHTRERFEGLVGTIPAGANPIAALAERIRSGALDVRWQEALPVILADTVERVRIVRPGALAPEHSPDSG